MTIKEKARNISSKIKQLLTSWQGWLAFILANIIWSLPWIVQLLIGWLTNNPTWLASASATAAFMALPFPFPMWLITTLTALGIYKLIKNDKVLY
jgi:hypothetical protein